MAGRRAAEVEALRDVRATTELLARAVIAPAVDDAVLRGDPRALQRLDAIVQRQVLAEPAAGAVGWAPWRLT